MKQFGLKPADWIKEIIAKEINSFYFELLENQYLSKEIDFENIWN